MEEKVLMAALAGLLHDVGKFAQRAGEQVSAEWSENKTKTDFVYQHALHTWHFVNKYLPSAFKEAGTDAAFHHRPRGDGISIQIADHLSAGERRNDEQDDSDTKSHPRQLQSIFYTLFEYGKNATDKKYLPLSALKLEREVIFPAPVLAEKDGKVWNQYRALYAEFCAEAEALKTLHEKQPDLESYLESMLALTQKFTWCIPSAYFKAVPDVSLYDHSRMTAALAAVLSEFPQEGLAARVKSSEPVALLIGGDISGIQKFIYTITSKKAAQTLRGRSFYLQLLTEAVLRFVLNELGIPYTNVIYSGGGHFFLLAPVSAEEKLPALRNEITKKILTHHGTSLYFALGFTQVPAYEFEAEKFPKAWERMHADLGNAKTQRYTELGDEMHAKVFAIAEKGGNPDTTCSVCGGDALSIVEESRDEDGNSVKVCSLCDSFSKKLGKVLPDAKFAALGWQKPADTKSATFEEALLSFGLRAQLLTSEKDEVNLKHAERITLWALDDPKNGYPATGNIPAVHLLRYTVNDVPTDKGEIITFDELQKKVDGGFKRLGVLRMDVDNLGDVFKKGLGSYATLARISTLSFQMSLFFEGWVKRICEQFNGKIYAVYAGGDDVFLIAPWDVMPELALNIRNDFAKYTANHPDLHISAGLAFIGGKYPIYQAADDAEAILKSAKKNDGKNSFGFIGNAWTWVEFLEVRDKFERIVKIVSDKNGPHAIIQTLRELAEMKLERQKGDKEIWGPWQWRGAYLLKRMEERAKDELAREIKSIRESLDKNGYADIKQWGAAARWAQLQTRTKKESTKKGE